MKPIHNSSLEDFDDSELIKEVILRIGEYSKVNFRGVVVEEFPRARKELTKVLYEITKH